MLRLHSLCTLIALTASLGFCKTENVIFVMTDGLRWQEVFRGADQALMPKEEMAALKAKYWREDLRDRRAALMPFLWQTIAAQGQVFGNRDKGSDAYVTNNFWFSYPGYSETLCGFADPRIQSNDDVPNPSVTVLEWLNKRPELSGKIAAFGAWKVIAEVVNGARGHFPANAGWAPFAGLPANPEVNLLNKLKAENPRVWPDEPFDALPFHTALQYLQARKPRVLYLSLGETDEWAHDNKYAHYLDAAHRVDAYLAELWAAVQSMPEYKDRTTLIFSPDHGRGEGREWTDHGQKVPLSKYIWMAFLGPDTPALGERSKIPAVTQNQIAATLAALLGADYNAAVPEAGKPIADVLSQRTDSASATLRVSGRSVRPAAGSIRAATLFFDLPKRMNVFSTR